MTLQSESIAKLMPALIKAKTNFAPAVKDSTNPAFRSKYASLDAVIEAVNSALLAERIAIVQQTDVSEHVAAVPVVLVTRLVHESGEWIGSRYPVKPVKQDPQGEGSALTYARRYALMALVGIAPEDDDGNSASNAKPALRKPSSSVTVACDKPVHPIMNGDGQEAQKFANAIACATTRDELTAVGSEISAASLSNLERTELRKDFSERMAVFS